MMTKTTRACVAAVSLALLAAAASGCGGKQETPGAASSSAPAATAPTEATPAPSQPASASELAGTSWRLVKIMSMDDSTYTPDDPFVYTLTFAADGGASIQADCNRGSGTYTSESPGRLRFGVIAATQAECAPGSLHDRYMSQFQWVRSYVFENGHLFLATMADGSIIEFEPAGTQAPETPAN